MSAKNEAPGRGGGSGAVAKDSRRAAEYTADPDVMGMTLAGIELMLEVARVTGERLPVLDGAIAAMRQLLAEAERTEAPGQRRARRGRRAAIGGAA